MFEAMGETDTVALDAMKEACSLYLPEAIKSDHAHIWLAVTESDWPVASAALIIDQHLPTPNNLSGRVAYILSVVTDPDYRRQGLARRLLQTMLNWINAQGITRVTLTATDDGAALYQTLGFKPANGEMKLDLASGS
jgi:ribosomal protein S18 acetylase RimI-like enzyme